MDWQSADGVARILVGDCLQRLRDLPDCSVQCCVTSPPYWGLRDYGNDAQLGLESTPEKYVENMVAVFREVHRILRKDGTLWLNLGDCYAGSWGNYGGKNRGKGKQREILTGSKSHNPAYDELADWRPPTSNKIKGIKPKDLVGIPWRVAFALQAEGWWLRQDVIWHKLNPMPESVTDRCTKAHEYVFLLTKSERYYYDAEAVKEAFADERQGNPGKYRWKYGEGAGKGKGSTSLLKDDGMVHGWNADGKATGRNRRSVWKVSTKPYKGAHFATMPPDLVEPCILAGTSEAGCCESCGAPVKRATQKNRVATRPGRQSKYGTPDEDIRGGSETLRERHIVQTTTTGWLPSCECKAGVIPCIVLDPFGGSGTTVAVAAKLGRRGICCELNPEYVKLAIERITPNLPSAKHPLLKG